MFLRAVLVVSILSLSTIVVGAYPHKILHLTNYSAVLEALDNGHSVQYVADYSKVVPPLGAKKTVGHMRTWEWFDPTRAWETD